MHSTLSRRGFLTTLSSAGIAGLTGTPGVFAQEAPPEITTIRLAKNQSLCIGPQYVAEDLLRAEGFTTVRYLTTDGGAGQARMLAQGEIDFTLHFSPLLLIPIDAGKRSRSLPGCTSAVSNCLRPIASAPSPTSRARRSGCKT